MVLRDFLTSSKGSLHSNQKGRLPNLSSEKLVAALKAEEEAEEEDKGRKRMFRRSTRTGALSSCSSDARALMQRAAMVTCGSVIERSTLEEIIESDRRRTRGCLRLLLTMLMAASHSASFMMHQEVTQDHLLNAPLRHVLYRPLEKVNTTRDVWRWVDQTFVPYFFEQRNMYGESRSPEEWSRILQFNQLQGGVMLEQARSIVSTCQNALVKKVDCHPQGQLSLEPFGRPLSALGDEFNMSVTEGSSDGFTPKPRGRRLRSMQEELFAWLPDSAPADLTFGFFLPRSLPIADIRRRIEYLRKRRWLDDQTAMVAIKAILLNNEFGKPRLLRVKVTFAFSRGGGIFTALNMESLILQDGNKGTSSSLNAITAISMILLTIFTGWTIYALIKSIKFGYMKQHLREVATILAWVNIILICVDFVVASLAESMQTTVIEKLGELNSLNSSTTSTGVVDAEVAEEFHNVVGRVMDVSSTLHTLQNYVILLLMMRCFLDLEFQPRLAVVLATLQATSIDLLHFLIIIVPVFTAFALAGMAAFGLRVDTFSSVEKAIGTCFRIAIENEYEWDTLSQEDYLTAFLWIIFYTLLFVLIILNMVLAMIMDFYSEVQSKRVSQETIWQSLCWLFNRARFCRRWVRSYQLLEGVKDLPSAFTLDELQEALPTMPRQQFDWLTNWAQFKAETSLRTSKDEKFCSRMLSAMHVGLSLSHQALHNVTKRRSVPTGAEAPKRSDKDCYSDIVQSIDLQNSLMAELQEQLDYLKYTEDVEKIETQKSEGQGSSRL